jgi:hypothetical protein
MTPKQTQEPAAWMHDNYAFRSIDEARYDQERHERCGCKRKPIIPLYAHPAPAPKPTQEPVQTPMTDAQIETTEWSDHIDEALGLVLDSALSREGA